jgi:glycosyltransferase involved in cell wall biosynthesis
LSGANVTALMPLRDHVPVFLKQAIGSLHAQTCPHWRLLVITEVEDAVRLRATLRDALVDHRMELAENEGRGFAAALNTGIRRAGTDFVAILFADDMWAPDAVAVLSDRIAAHPDVDLFHSSRCYIDERGLPLSSVYTSPGRVCVDDFERGSPVHHLLCWRRAAALAAGGVDESLPPVGPDDYDLPWTLAERGARFMALPQCLYLYRDHRECPRLTTHLPRSVHARGLWRILRKHGVGRASAALKVSRAVGTYMRQSLYLNALDRRRKLRRGDDPRSGWRRRYLTGGAYPPRGLSKNRAPKV